MAANASDDERPSDSTERSRTERDSDTLRTLATWGTFRAVTNEDDGPDSGADALRRAESGDLTTGEVATEDTAVDAPSGGDAWRHVPLVMIVLLTVATLTSLQETGHGWGDDFSLYVHQAKALVKGDIGRLISDTRFALDNSVSHTWTPVVYPWGFPILLAPVYALFGLNWFALKAVIVACYCGVLVAFHHLLRRRSGVVVATAATTFLASSPTFWKWAESVTSDIPSLAFVLLAFVWMERTRTHGLLDPANRRRLVVMGLLMAWCFSIRHETIALAPALLSLHLVEVWRRRTDIREQGWRAIPYRLVVLPYLVAAGAVLALQAMLPSTLVVDRPATGGRGMLGENARWYKGVIAEAFGLKQFGNKPIVAFGSEQLGSALVLVFVGLAVVGAIVSLYRHRTRDLHLLVFVVLTAYAVGTQPFHEFRYLYTTLVVMVFFAVQAFTAWDATPTTSPRPLRRSLGGAVATAVLLLPLSVNLADLGRAVEYHRSYDYVLRGPESPDSQAMFEAVLRCTRGDDIVMFSQARSMNLYTGRRAVQGGSIPWLLQRADWLVLDNDDVDYNEPAIHEEEAAQYGLERVWHNTTYTLYRVPHTPRSPFEACPVE